MKRKTTEEMLDEFYEREGIDRARFQRNDDRAFQQIKQDKEYNDIRLEVLRELGANI